MFKIKNFSESSGFKNPESKNLSNNLTRNTLRGNLTIYNNNNSRNFELTENRLKTNPPTYYIRKVTTPYNYDINKVSLAYSNKQSNEEIFTEKVKYILKKESKGSITLNDIMSQTTKSKDSFLPNAYIYYDYINKNPKLLKGNDLSLNKRNCKSLRNKWEKTDVLNSELLKEIYSKTNNNYFNKNYNIEGNFHDNNKEENVNDINNDNKKEENDNTENKEEEEKKEENNLNEKTNIENTKIEINDNIENSNNKTNNTNESPKENTNKNERKKKEETLIEKEKMIPKISKKDEIKYKYILSDPFNLRNENIFKSKSGEKYLFSPKEESKTNKIYMNYLSNSSWIPNIPKRINYCGHTSVHYNIISPEKKSIFKTREEIDNNQIKIHHKVKSVSNIIDLNWESSPHITPQFVNSINSNFNYFSRKKNVGGCHLDLFHTYRETCPHPFS